MLTFNSSTTKSFKAVTLVKTIYLIFPTFNKMVLEKNRNHLIDLLRFISASWIVLLHCNDPIPYIDNWYRNFCRIGHLGVPVFFIVSGYCICLAERHTKTSGEFIVRRLFRIFPPYWFSIIVTCICVLTLKIIIGTNSVTALPKNVQGILATLFLCTHPLSNVGTINWVYWTLTYELFFYLMIFLSLILPKQLKTPFLFVLTITSVLLPFQWVGILFFFNELPLFMLGYALFLLINKCENIWVNSLLFVLSIIGIFLKHPSWDYFLVAFIVCTAIFFDYLKPLRNNIFSRFGDYSYSTYLLHIPICLYLLGFIKNEEIIQHNIYLNIIADFSLLALILFISKWSFKLVELPSIKWGKNLLGKTN